ncbi:alkylhydroperoxidase AhpD family core domain-containing protein [Chitinophaga sp. YR627]|uniref:carboxymuconolactone decarboxylase family protein n=1 Tax=Chitinophaga sp. YR627 TaxID=1881041 RepID=UPI0008F0F968|nr:carboxymuconolactone decarboxylase family protein [Chitinophaga sp. YR627]SFO57766.1 alkylhydroperoxidase AhpD family core domain-containing protein [Chitinophaga sp. YR627]
MTQRISLQEMPAALMTSLGKIGAYLKTCNIDQKLLSLLYYRASQINGCACCLDIHHKESIHLGDTQVRLHGVIAWRESPYYDAKERAALAFTEALTNANQQDIDDSIFDALTEHFTPEEITELTMAIATVNTWNRLNKTFRTTPGHYKVGQYA